MKRFSFFFFLFYATCSAAAEPPVKPSVVPVEFQWVRSLDIEGFTQAENQRHTGIQHFHMRLRYLDPDVNAFIGMQTDVDHFNREISLGDPDNPGTGEFLADMGAHIGIVRGRHTWELDVMGVTAGGKLGPALAIVGEHRFGQRWTYYHRLQGDIFVGDGLFDLDQGLYCMLGKTWGFTAGYRWCTSLHFDRSGPHIGLRYYFQNPHIPFIFPSLG